MPPLQCLTRPGLAYRGAGLDLAATDIYLEPSGVLALEVEIDGKRLGGDNRCYTIAEAGANHDNSIDQAFQLIDAAASSGADSIKFQTYKASRLVTKTAPKYWGDGGGSQFDVFSRLDAVDRDGWAEILEHAQKSSITCFSTPFDEQSADMLYELGVPAFKIASADITHIPLVRHVAKKGLPVFISTGMASNAEVDEAVSAIEDCGNHSIIIMHCVTSYPTAYEDARIGTIPELSRRYSRHVVGYSDHTLGTVIPVCSVAYGSKAVEKHFTIDNSLEQSPDHWLSLDAERFAEMVSGIRQVEAAEGSRPLDGALAAESEATKYARRSIVAVQDIHPGTVITSSMLAVKRPGTGIYPKFLDRVIGATALRNIAADIPLQWQDVE